MTTAEQMINAQWFIEVKIPGRDWMAIAPTDNDRMSPMNRAEWKDAQEEFSNYPLRIKAYVRHEHRSNPGTFYVNRTRPPAKYDLEEAGEE